MEMREKIRLPLYCIPTRQDSVHPVACRLPPIPEYANSLALGVPKNSERGAFNCCCVRALARQAWRSFSTYSIFTP